MSSAALTAKEDHSSGKNLWLISRYFLQGLNRKVSCFLTIQSYILQQTKSLHDTGKGFFLSQYYFF